MRNAPATSATTTTTTLVRKIEPHQKCSSSQPLMTPPSATPTPAKPAQIAMACGRSSGGNTWARIDSVAGITNAAPMPMTARAAISCAGGARERRDSDAAPKTIEAAVQREPPPVPVAERAGGEQQAGEHEAVGVDDPLQRARRRRAGRSTSVGQRDVEAGVGHHDHHEADAQHAERPPAALVLPLGGRLLAVQLLPEGGLAGEVVLPWRGGDGVLFDAHRTSPTRSGANVSGIPKNSLGLLSDDDRGGADSTRHAGRDDDRGGGLSRGRRQK